MNNMIIKIDKYKYILNKLYIYHQFIYNNTLIIKKI